MSNMQRKMNNMRATISIRSYILSMILALLAGVFLVIIGAFNILVGQYVKSDAYAQLDAATGRLEEVRGEKNSNTRPTLPNLENIPPSRIGTSAESFFVDADYALPYTDYTTPSDQASSAEEQIVQALQKQGVEITNTNNHALRTDTRQYYITIRAFPYSTTVPLYVIYYIDVTSINNFAFRANMFLLSIIGIALLAAGAIAVMISRYIARPMLDMSAFAARVGQGDFTPCKAYYQGRELQYLTNSMNTMAMKLETYDKDQKTFFQNASHELRTPLMSIKCYAEGIAYGVMEPDTASKTIIQETDRLSGMVEDLLYISRIDNISSNYGAQEYDLRELFSMCAEQQKSIAESSHIHFVFDFDKTPVPFRCVEKLMSRALSNLISNAVRFAKSEVKLTCRQERRQILLAVTDDGPGIAQEDLPHIFERFYKGESGKHGIGLSIVKSVFAQYGGQIQAENADKGARFSVRLQVAPKK